MSLYATSTFTLFDGHRQVASGALGSVALALKAIAAEATGPLLVFDDHNGQVVDLDVRGSDQQILARLATAAPAPAIESVSASEVRARGRPKLGVIAREVTLLPRHWEWLAAQPGGASVALRKLVEQARRNSGEKLRSEQARERAYRVMAALAGDLPGFEEASRSLFGHDYPQFCRHIADWPQDVRAYVLSLGFDGDDQARCDEL